MITATAKIHESEKRKARVNDNASRGLNVGHLRLFLQQVERLGLPDDMKVRLTENLNRSGSWYTVEIEAERSVTISRDPEQVVPEGRTLVQKSDAMLRAQRG